MWFFLTAYDPSDLPGTSIDPLGFERGYLFLADKILPGMTNVANCPRYFAMICSAILMAEVSNDTSPNEQREIRQESILRLERLWALANVLCIDANDTNKNLSGLRGITYAQRQLEWLSEQGSNQTPVEFKLLSRQVPYGAIGIYGTVAENLKLLYKKTLELTPGLGAKLAEEFINSTQMPKSLQYGVKTGGSVPLNTLRYWGEKAYLWGNPSKEESECYYEMLHSNSVRSRFANLLDSTPFMGEGDNELKRLGRVFRLATSKGEISLAESVQGILHYENCYRHAMVGLERLLYLCHTHGGAISLDILASDEVLKKIRETLPDLVNSFNKHLSSATTEHFVMDTGNRLKDVLLFLDTATDKIDRNIDLAEAIVTRHTDIQHGKFDRGQRKMPWLQRQNGSLLLTMARTSGSTVEIKDPEQVNPHPYRLYAADAWIEAAK